MQVFLSDDDYRAYRTILAHQARRYQLRVWAYCLMPNHVHLVASPATADGLALPIGQAHRQFALQINRRERWTGHLWQERFSSFPLDEIHLLAAVRYVLLNPMRAGLVDRVEHWPYSSAQAHFGDNSDPLVYVEAMASRVENWRDYLESSESEEMLQDIRKHSRNGRPLGTNEFVRRLERILGRQLRPQKPGPKAQAKG